ncbi:uncharacterized protein LOC118765378 [Octopus sinensis]|uniref:Uncharacterized protein LOC118765378 n=1 Tax=Octopus sinensis TaxID=2607531 RepID=A0A7E6F8F9_9MOLL|nr:uncharacterized protein LOC118765378 [Octopus sinensis]
MVHFEIERHNDNTLEKCQVQLNGIKESFHSVLPNFRGFVKSITYKLHEIFNEHLFLFKMKQKRIGKSNTKQETEENFENVVRKPSKKLERTSLLLSPITFVRSLISSKKNEDDLMDETQADQIEICMEPTVKNKAGSSLITNAMADCLISDSPNLNTDERERLRALPSEAINALFSHSTSRERAYFIVTLLSVAFTFDDIMPPEQFGRNCSMTTTLFAPGTIFILTFVNWVFSIITLLS